VFLTTPNCQGQTGIISTRQHESIKKLFDCVNLSLFQICGCSADVGLIFANFDLLLLKINGITLAKLYDQDACHDFGQWSHLLTIFTIKWNHHFQSFLMLLSLTNYIRFGSNFGWRDEWLRIVFIYLLHEWQFGLFLLFDAFLIGVIADMVKRFEILRLSLQPYLNSRSFLLHFIKILKWFGRHICLLAQCRLLVDNFGRDLSSSLEMASLLYAMIFVVESSPVNLVRPR